MIRHRWLIAAFSVLLMLELGLAQAGDAKKDKQDAPTPSYYPLEVGNRWDFDVTVNGNRQSMNAKIARIETIDDVPLAVLEAEIGGKIGATEHLRHAPKGLLRYRTGKIVADPPLVLLPNPVKPGDKWSGPLNVGADKAKYSSEAQEEMVEVPAGKFKTLRVTTKMEQDGKIITVTYWYAPDVGFVKHTFNADGLNLLAELRKFEPKQAAPKH